VIALPKMGFSKKYGSPQAQTIKNQRSGCLLCKPWKMTGYAQNRPDAESFSDHRRRHSADSELNDFESEDFRRSLAHEAG
jgi:hypothetical protein